MHQAESIQQARAGRLPELRGRLAAVRLAARALGRPHVGHQRRYRGESQGAPPVALQHRGAQRRQPQPGPCTRATLKDLGHRVDGLHACQPRMTRMRQSETWRLSRHTWPWLQRAATAAGACCRTRYIAQLRHECTVRKPRLTPRGSAARSRTAPRRWGRCPGCPARGWTPSAGCRCQSRPTAPCAAPPAAFKGAQH